MANGNGKKTDSKATLGEAVGLASQEQMQAAIKAREASENRADKLADRVMQLEKALADEEEKGTENAGLLADLTDNLFEDDERAAKHGYIGVVERAKELVGQLKEATQKCAEETAKALEAQHYAEREAVKAKGEAAREARNHRTADAAIHIVENALAHERKRRQEAKIEAADLRKTLQQSERFARSALLMLEAICGSDPVEKDGKQFYPALFLVETADKLRQEIGEHVGHAAEKAAKKDTVRREVVVEVKPDYMKPIVCPKCGTWKNHFEHQVVAERQLLRWCEGKGYDLMESELEEVLRTESITCSACGEEIDVEVAQTDEVIKATFTEAADVPAPKLGVRGIMAMAATVITGAGIAPEVVDAVMAITPEE